MRLAYRHLAKYALAAGCTVSVWDGEEWSLRKSTCLNSICNEIKGVEEAQMRIWNGSNTVAIANVSPYGLAPEETVIDHSDNEWMAAWQAQYDKDSGENP